MRVAVWDHLPALLFAARQNELPVDVEFVRIPASSATEELTRGAVDVALLSTLSVLQDTQAYDVFPAVGLSSWDFPFAKLFLSGGLGASVTSLGYEEGRELEALVARVVLREHYGSDVQVRSASAEELLNARVDASLVVGPNAHRIAVRGHAMDLGREWFELANYPMVWGLFATAKGNGSRAAIVALRDAVAHLDQLRQIRARSVEDDDVRDFVENQVRLRLDDLAVASLTELCNYVYYYGAVADYSTVPFMSLEEEEDEDDSRGGLLV